MTEIDNSDLDALLRELGDTQNAATASIRAKAGAVIGELRLLRQMLAEKADD